MGVESCSKAEYGFDDDDEFRTGFDSARGKEAVGEEDAGVLSERFELTTFHS